jgi:hypothetical protein
VKRHSDYINRCFTQEAQYFEHRALFFVSMLFCNWQGLCKTKLNKTSLPGITALPTSESKGE